MFCFVSDLIVIIAKLTLSELTVIFSFLKTRFVYELSVRCKCIDKDLYAIHASVQRYRFAHEAECMVLVHS